MISETATSYIIPAENEARSMACGKIVVFGCWLLLIFKKSVPEKKIRKTSISCPGNMASAASKRDIFRNLLCLILLRKKFLFRKLLEYEKAFRALKVPEGEANLIFFLWRHGFWFWLSRLKGCEFFHRLINSHLASFVVGACFLSGKIRTNSFAKGSFSLQNWYSKIIDFIDSPWWGASDVVMLKQRHSDLIRASFWWRIIYWSVIAEILLKCSTKCSHFAF